ncbi:MAG: YARHG domain-containing protein [Pyrinomonadaceae bacterium]|nr:YARHG domain-containing protein [Pyrinomonadaceae bacterium]
MRKIAKFLFVLSILAAATSTLVRANDGVFYVRGNNLIPMQETQVELRKEVLKFYVTDFGWMEVDVDFTFFNPGPAKEVVVGFVTPPAGGDTDEEQHPQIKNFTVNVNGKKLPYKMKRMGETSFSFVKLKFDEVDYVYYFTVRFEPGSNRIRHTYTYRGGGSVELQRDFEYQITTGKRWANRQIDDFEMQVHLDNGVYSIPASFRNDGKLANWNIVGHGVIAPTPRSWFGDDSPKIRMAHLNRGYLSLKEKDFKPDNDIMFAEYNWAAGWVERWCDFAHECVDRKSLENIVNYFTLNPWEGVTAEDLSKLSERELKLVRNYFYALRGYDFKTIMVRKFYSQFFWYRPDPELKWDKVNLSGAEKAFVAKVVEAEERK